MRFLTPGFDPENEIEGLAAASTVIGTFHGLGRINAKQGKERLETIFAPSSGMTVTEIRVAHVECFIVHFPESQVTYLCFQGSRDIQDWIVNLDFGFVPYPDFKGRVHRGFLNTQRTVLEEVLYRAYGLDALHRDNQLIACGHSQGGATAQLAALSMHKTDPKMRPLCITVGSPCVGDHNWTFGFRNRIVHHRIQNYWDVITWMQRLLPKQNARHAAEALHWLRPKGEYQRLTGAAQPKWNILELLAATWNPASPDHIIHSHAPWVYERRVNELRSR